MKSIVTVAGPAQAGPGERQLMLDAAHGALDQLGASEVTRIDVPGRGSGEAAEESGLRPAVAGAVPALQSGSLFGGNPAVLVVDAHQLLKPEAAILAELIEVAAADPSIVAVFVAAGTIPAPLGAALRSAGETIKVDRLTERRAASWLVEAARGRGLGLAGDTVEALLQRFGTDVGALGRALDQLAVDGRPLSGDLIRERFKNRPDEPMWHIGDAIASGDTGETLRRLEDFLIHGHPLQLLAFLQNDVRRRALAAGSPDYETFVERDGGRKGYGMEKVWKVRHRPRDSDLRRAVSALARADLQLKTMPEPTHRVTMERLVVALCHWYGGRS